MKNVSELLRGVAKFGGSLKVECQKVEIVGDAPELDNLRKYLSRFDTQLMAFAERRKGKREGIPKADARASYPVTSPQRRLFAIQKSTDCGIQYNMPSGYTLTGEISVEKFRVAIGRVLEANSSLRTYYKVEGGEVLQCLKKANVDEVLEVRKLLGATVDSATQGFVRPFDLEGEVPVRFRLTKISNGKWIFEVDIHHIAADGSCYARIVSDIFRAYDNLEILRETVNYADFSVWCNEGGGVEILRKHRDYWLEMFADLPPEPNHPIASGEAYEQKYTEGGVVDFDLEPSLVSKIRSLAEALNCSVQNVMLGAWSLLVGKITGVDDMVIGIASSGRFTRELEHLSGMFVNTLPVRLKNIRGSNRDHFIGNLRDSIVSAVSHEMYPLEDLLDELNVVHSSKLRKLFDTMFSFQHQEMYEGTSDLEYVSDKPRQFCEFEVEGIESSWCSAKFELTLYAIARANDRLKVQLEYAVKSFDRATARLICDRYVWILEQLVSCENIELDKVTLVPKAERERLLALGMGAALKKASNRTLDGLFGERARTSPDSVAARCGKTELTYGELDERSDRLAGYLVDALGVSPGSKVGLMGDRSLETVVGILGILKAGCGYVPFDSSYPQERLAFMLEDCDCAAVLVQGEAPDWVDGVPSLDLLFGDYLSAQRISGSLSSSDSLAYVIYTSGSTGRPKGVEVEHGNVVDMMVGCDSLYSFSADDVWSVFHSFSFDFSVWELWGALLFGGRIVVVPWETSRSPLDFLNLIRSEGVTMLSQTPSAFLSFCEVEKGERELLDSLRWIVFGGEALHYSSLRGWLDRYGDDSPRLANMYGITETTVHVTHRRVREREVAGSCGSYIGVPLPGYSLQVRGTDGSLCAFGVTGELYVGGAGVARGYLRREELTSERFLLDPFSPDGGRLYRTGDLARWRSDGELEYLGRVDDQVKIRGFRIELGEIANTIHSVEGVRDTAVIAREDEAGEKYLVAYVAPEPELKDDETGPLNGDSERAEAWNNVFDETYGRSEVKEADSDWTGWDSSYTGAPISISEMREWTDATVNRILELKPRRVLEIGCGMGLLLFRLAPSCEHYVGTDLSAVAVESVSDEIARRSGLSDRVEVKRHAAHELDGFETESFDVIVINSVVQYFPSLDYLQTVLGQAWDLLEDGGAMFVGDVLNERLLEAFHASVQAYLSEPDDSVVTVRQRVQESLLGESELFISPEYFSRFCHDRSARAWIRPKETLAPNEMSRFRYDATLRKGVEVMQNELESLPWSEVGTQEALLEFAQGRDGTLRIAGVPNSLCCPALEVARVLSCPSRASSVKGLKDRLGHILESVSGPTPGSLVQAIEDLGLFASSSLHGDGGEGLFDLVFSNEPLEEYVLAWHFSLRAEGHALSTSPERARSLPAWIGRMRTTLEKALPEYMIPARFVPLASLPKMPSGKVDSRSLPKPEVGPERAFYEAPRDELEFELAAMFSEVLGLERVGVKDSFFDLGGHSLKAVRLISLAKETFDAHVEVRDLFDQPSVRGLASVIRTAGRASLSRIERSPEREWYPATSQQSRLYAIQQTDATGIAYNMPCSFLLRGDVDVARIGVALQELVSKRSGLRAALDFRGGEVMQRIESKVVADFVYEERLGASAAEASEGFVRSFDLNGGSLARARVLRLGEQEYLLQIDMHHIAVDGGCYSRLLEELFEAYDGGRLDEEALRYVDYSVWRREGEGAHEYKEHEAYWLDLHASPPPALDLPLDRPRGVHRDYQGDRIDFSLPDDLVVSLRALARKERSTLQAVLFSVWQALIARLGGVEDLCVGVPASGRDRSELEGVCGMFVNTLPIRSRPQSGKRFTKLLRETRDSMLGGLEHQSYSLEDLVERVQGGGNRNALFDTVFNYLEPSMVGRRLKMGEVEAVGLETPLQASKFDLTLMIFETERDVVGVLEYAGNLFDKITVESLGRRYLHLATQVADSPQIELGKLDVLEPGESKTLLAWGRAGKQPEENELCLVDLFRNQVSRSPDRTAISWEEGELSYRELEDSSNVIAGHLQECLKGEVGAVVGIVARRTAETVISMLSILKAGGTYLPLDPSYPPERLEYMMADSSCQLVLSAEDIPVWLNGVECMCIGDIVDRPLKPFISNSNRSLAYIMYTSGSTGRPKGVMIEHRSVIRLVQSANYVKLDQSGCLLQTGSMSFDAATFEVWGSLVNGMVLRIASKDTLMDTRKFRDEIVEFKVTHLWLTSALFNQYVDADEGMFIGVREVIVGGDVVSPEHIRRASSVSPETRFINGYGPTENTTFSVCGTIDPNVAGTIPLGHPIAGSSCYILDEECRLCPRGIIGELYVGGLGVARGYVNDPTLTAQLFLYDPYVDNGDKMYRTGDLARWLPDGRIEFLGRRDGQVKIRGFRVELGEVEYLISTLPGVREVIVLALEAEGGDKSLAVYWTGEVSVDELRGYVRRKLPSHMVPSRFVELEKLPLTPNGKLDRKALSELEVSSRLGDLGELKRTYVEPRNKLESELVDILSKVLNLEKIGVEDGFFELGGNSLEAIKYISIINKRFKVEVGVMDLMEIDTIAELSEYLTVECQMGAHPGNMISRMLNKIIGRR